MIHAERQLLRLLLDATVRRREAERKMCPQCARLLPLDEFYQRGDGKRSGWCVICSVNSAARWNRDNRARHEASRRR